MKNEGKFKSKVPQILPLVGGKIQAFFWSPNTMNIEENFQFLFNFKKPSSLNPKVKEK